MGPYLPVIERWLLADEDAPRKQRHTAKRIYDRLVERIRLRRLRGDGAPGGARLRGAASRSSCLWRPPGKVAQADFGRPTC